MKKLLSLLLTLVMLLGCTAFAEMADYTGVWVLDSFGAYGVVLPASMLGMTYEVLLREDGTASLESEGEAEEGTWVVTENGVNVTDSTDYVWEATREGSTLVVEDADFTATFIRGGIFMVAGAANQMSLDDLLGRWVLTRGALWGIEVPTDLLGMEMEFTLAADGGTYIHNTDEELITKEIIYTVAQTQDGLTVTLRPVGEKRDLLVLNTNDAGDLVAEDDFGLQMIFEKQTQD